MSKRHGAREQKRLVKQKSKREDKRRQLARRSSPDPNIRLEEAADWPIVATLVPETLWEVGLGTLVIARRMPGGQLACAFFLVDVFCLGVKNAFWKIIAAHEFGGLRDCIDVQGRLEEVTPEHFAKLIYQAADYGQLLGFSPHRDFRHAQRLLAGIDLGSCPDEFTFGMEGQPLFIPGPNESAADSRAIWDRLDEFAEEHLALTSSEDSLKQNDVVDGTVVGKLRRER